MSTRETPTHSPAPWWLDDWSHLRAEDEAPICDLHPASEPDRRLILKAPELLALVRQSVLEAERSSLDRGSARYAAMKALVDHIDGTGKT
jgi:hypothetical protein